MEAKTLYKSQYKYGNLTYVVSIMKRFGDVDWKTGHEISDWRYFVEYDEETLPSRNSVGGFSSLDEALNWTNEHFGPLEWTVLQDD